MLDRRFVLCVLLGTSGLLLMLLSGCAKSPADNGGMTAQSTPARPAAAPAAPTTEPTEGPVSWTSVAPGSSSATPAPSSPAPSAPEPTRTCLRADPTGNASFCHDPKFPNYHRWICEGGMPANANENRKLVGDCVNVGPHRDFNINNWCCS